MKKPRVLLFDIETAPMLAWTWERFETNVIGVVSETYMLCFAYKWLGEHRVHTCALPDYPGYPKDRTNDGKLVRDLWRVMDEADIVIAHNGDSFDIKKVNARFLVHGLNAPDPFKSVDTLKVARRHFRFDSNKLNDLGGYLGVGKKLPHTGFDLWRRCMAGDPSAWRVMRRYNAQDVRLLERVYLKLRSWDKSHPNLTLYSGVAGCPTCQSPHIQRRGVNVSKVTVSPRFQCQDCGTWFSGKSGPNGKKAA